MTLFIGVLQMLEIMMGFRVKNEREPLVAGTYEQGYYGEVSSVDFINGDALATQIGLTTGTAFNSDAGWLKFSLDYKTLYVSKRPFRYSVSWDQINAVGAVFGTTQVTINGKTYKVRLLKGRGDNLINAAVKGYDVPATHGSEWNRLMYHVAGAPLGNASNSLASEGITLGDWVQFNASQLLTDIT
jgi:hypothetical protein